VTFLLGTTKIGSPLHCHSTVESFFHFLCGIVVVYCDDEAWHIAMAFFWILWLVTLPVCAKVINPTDEWDVLQPVKPLPFLFIGSYHLRKFEETFIAPKGFLMSTNSFDVRNTATRIAAPLLPFVVILLTCQWLFQCPCVALRSSPASFFLSSFDSRKLFCHFCLFLLHIFELLGKLCH